MDDALGRAALRSLQFLAVAVAVWVLFTLLGRVLVIVVPVILAVSSPRCSSPPPRGCAARLEDHVPHLIEVVVPTLT